MLRRRLVAILIVPALPGWALAATIRVPEDEPDLATAVAGASAGDIIEIGEGTFDGALAPSVDLTLRGSGEATRLIGSDLAEDAPILTVSGTALRLESLRIQADGAQGIRASEADLELIDVSIVEGAHSLAGGGIDQAGGRLQLERVELIDNRSAEGLGGQVRAVGVEVELVDGRVEGGRAERGGGLYVLGGSLRVEGTRFERNAASRGENRGVGGAIATERADVEILNADFVDNRVIDGQGGAISLFLGRATIRGTSFEGKPGSPSATEYYGGGLASYDAPLVVENCSFRDLSVEHSGEEGSFGYGAGIIVYGPAGARFEIRDSTFEGNAVSAFGGGIRIDSGAGVIEGSTFIDNLADYGGAIHVASPDEVRVQDSVFTGNRGRFAGAIRWRPPSAAGETSALVLDGNRFEDNLADNYGGVLYGRNGGRFEAVDNHMQANEGTLGGALMVWAVRDVALVRNRFCANVATGGTAPDGGAVASYQSGRGTYTIANNLFLDNQAGGHGGGLSLLQDGDVDLRHNTFLGNAAPDGSAVGIRGASEAPVVLRAHDSLFAYQLGGPTFGGSSVARFELEHSAFFDNEGEDVEALLDPLEVDVLRADPQLQAFSAGGDCASHVPFPQWGSPLIDAADPEGLDLDGSRADIGASGGPEAYPELWLDEDADGSPVLFDCDDSDADRAPIASELPYDGIDQDCDGADLDDIDGDGFPGGEGPDCDDEDPAIRPGAEGLPGDGIDQDCDGADRALPAEPVDPEPPTEPEGCACTSAGPSPASVAGIALGLLLLGRRRMRR